MNVNFYLKDSKKTNSAVFAIVRHRGNRFKLSPGVSVLTQYWDVGTHRAAEKKKNPEAARINIVLDRFEGEIKKIFETHILARTSPTLAEIKTQLKKPLTDEVNRFYFTDYFKKHYETAEIKTLTRKKYTTVYNWLVKYEIRNGTRLTFAAINMDFYTDFKFWILNKTYIPKPGAAPRYYSLNYFGSIIKCIKRVMQISGPDSRIKLHNNRDYANEEFKTTAETADTIYLTTAELLKIHRFTATAANISAITTDPRLENRQRKATALNMAKNKFIIGAFTALRVSDFNRLEAINLNTGFITIRPIKGSIKNKPVIIPIHPVIKEILNTGFNLAAPISEQKINKHIKQVAQLVGISAPVVVSRTEGFTSEVIERTYFKHELISTHTARRSGATNMFLAGIQSISIMKITGHKTESSFLKYIKISQEENARLLATHPFFN